MEFESLLPYVLPSVQGCPDAVAIHHLREASIRFCERTLLWTEDLPAITTAADATDYSLNLDDGVDLVKLLSVRVGTEDYAPVSARDGRSLIRATTGDRIAFTANKLDLVIHPAAAAGLDLVCEVALKPAITATDLSDDLQQYAKTIADGALSTLFAIPRRDWTDGALATHHAALFQDRLDTIATQAARGFSSARLRTRAHFF